MRRPRPALLRSACALLLWCAPIPAARAQETPPQKAKAWSDVAELGYVATSGNSESSTLGFKNTLGRKWDASAFELKAGGVRATTTALTRTAVSTGPSSFSIDETRETVLSAESYFLNGRYDRKISARVFWFTGGGWSRNRFAGIQNRYEAAAGLGNIWADTERLKFRTDYALSYTREDTVIDAPGGEDSFPGLRFSWKYVRLLGASTAFSNDLVVDENLDDTSDLRADMVNSVAVSMSKRLALKVSLQWVYDHEPAFEAIDLLDAPPPAGVKIGTVAGQLETLDTIFMASLVVSF